MGGSRLQKVLRNVAEPLDEFVMTLPDLERVLTEVEHPTVYIGYEPSGPIHLGTLLTIEKLAELTEIGFRSKALMADIHGFLNKKGPRELLEEVSETYWAETFRTLGSPSIEIVLGSEFELSPDYIMDLLVLSQRVTTARAWRAMDMIARETKHPTVGQHIYPIMQALDILYLGCDVAIGGTDQRKIHALARELFSSPVRLRHEKWVPVALHTPLIPGLIEGGKMSSSIPKSHIAIHDPPEVIRRKIRMAFCPPGGAPQYDEAGRLINPILAAFKYFILHDLGEVSLPRSKAAGGGDLKIGSYRDLESAYVNGLVHPQDLKNFVAEYLTNRFKPIRDRLEADPSLLEPLYRLQKWQMERGLMGEAEWRDAMVSYSHYLGGSLEG